MRCSTLTLNMILTKNKNMIHFKQRLQPNCLSHDFEIVTVNGGGSTGQYHTLLAVANFTGKQKKIKSGYFIAIPHIVNNVHLDCEIWYTCFAIKRSLQFYVILGIDND